MKKPPEYLRIIVLSFLTAVLLYSCYTENKAKQQFNKAILSYPHVPLDYCSAQFPDKPDSVIIRTDTLIEIATMDSLVYDTLLLNHDTTLIRTIVKTVKIYIKKDSIIYRENRAEQERLQLALLECQKTTAALVQKNTFLEQERNEWKGKARKRGWMFLGLIFLIVGAVGMRVYLKSKSIIK